MLEETERDAPIYAQHFFGRGSSNFRAFQELNTTTDHVNLVGFDEVSSEAVVLSIESHPSHESGRLHILARTKHVSIHYSDGFGL